MIGLRSFALKPGLSFLSDASSPVYPLCEAGASDAAVTNSLQSRGQGEEVTPKKGPSANRSGASYGGGVGYLRAHQQPLPYKE